MMHETALLTACLIHPEAAARVADTLQPADFVDAQAALVFTAIRSLVAEGQPVSRITVRDELRRLGTLEKAGGVEYLTQDLGGHAVLEDLGASLTSVQHESARRGMPADVTQFLTDLRTDPRPDRVRDAWDACRVRMERRLAVLRPPETPKSTREVMEDLMQEAGSGGAYTWSLPYLRGKLPDIRPSNFIVIAASTGLGKTTFMAQQAVYHARQGRPVLWIGLEMSRGEVMSVACRIEIGVNPLRAHGYNARSSDAVVQQWADTWEGYPLTVRHDLRELSSIVRAIRDACAAPVKPIVYLDYVQLISVRGITDDTPRITAVTATLKTLAMELGIPIVTASQFNRDAVKDPKRCPTLDQLRGSGSIEQDANGVLILWGHKESDREVDSEVQVKNAKWRNEPSGYSRPLLWLGKSGIIGDEETRAAQADWYASRDATSQMQRVEQLRQRLADGSHESARNRQEELPI